MASTYEEIMAKSRELYGSGDVEGAKRLAKIALSRKQQPSGGVPQLSSAFQQATTPQAGPPMPPEMALRNKAKNYYTQNDMGAGMSGVGGFAQGGTFGFSDEITAALQSLSPNVTYDQALAVERGRLDAARESHPVAAYGGEVAGAIASPGGIASKAETTAGKVGMGALAGALQGWAYGFGTGEGGAKERAINAAKSAAIGGAIGAAAPVAIAGARAGARAVANPIRSLFNMGSENQASSAIAKMLARSGMSQAEVDAALKAAASEGQPEFALADALGAPGQRALSGVARQPGEANAIVTEALTKRQGGQGDRLGSFVADALDAPDTAAQRAANLTAARGAAADTAYSSARQSAGAVNLNGAIDTIDTLLKRDPILGETALSQGPMGARLAALRARLAAGGEQLIDFDSVLAIKSDLYNQMQRNPQVAREMQPVYSALDSALENSSASYRAANDGFAKASRTIEQIDAGKAAASPRVRASDTVPAFNALTPEQQAAFRSGYSDPVLAKIEAAAPGVNKARPLLNEKTATELGAMANDPALLARRVGRENTMFETTNRALGGSKTADNLADIGDAKANSASAIINLLTGRWGAAAGQVADKLLAGATGSSPKSREMIAKLLLSSDINAALTPALRKKAAQVGVDNVIAALIRSGGISAAQ